MSILPDNTVVTEIEKAKSSGIVALTLNQVALLLVAHTSSSIICISFIPIFLRLSDIFLIVASLQ